MCLNLFFQLNQKDKMKYYIVVYTVINHMYTYLIIKNKIFN